MYESLLWLNDIGRVDVGVSLVHHKLFIFLPDAGWKRAQIFGEKDFDINDDQPILHKVLFQFNLLDVEGYALFVRIYNKLQNVHPIAFFFFTQWK